MFTMDDFNCLPVVEEWHTEKLEAIGQRLQGYRCANHSETCIPCTHRGFVQGEIDILVMRAIQENKWADACDALWCDIWERTRESPENSEMHSRNKHLHELKRYIEAACKDRNLLIENLMEKIDMRMKQLDALDKVEGDLKVAKELVEELKKKYGEEVSEALLKKQEGQPRN